MPFTYNISKMDQNRRQLLFGFLSCSYFFTVALSLFPGVTVTSIQVMIRKNIPVAELGDSRLSSVNGRWWHVWARSRIQAKVTIFNQLGTQGGNGSIVVTQIGKGKILGTQGGTGEAVVFTQGGQGETGVTHSGTGEIVITVRVTQASEVCRGSETYKNIAH